MVRLAAVVNLVSCASAPTALLWRYATGVHQPIERLSTSDQGADQGLGPIGGDQPNILPLDLTL